MNEMEEPNKTLLTEEVLFHQMTKYKTKEKITQVISLVSIFFFFFVVQFTELIELTKTVLVFWTITIFIALGLKTYYYKQKIKYHELWLGSLTKE